VVPGIGLFFILAVPALALDFINQGIEMIEFQSVTTEQANGNSNTNGPNRSPKVIKASPLVRTILIGAEYLILFADVVLILAVMVNGTWLFLKELKW
jgi:hypothetical protein